MGVTRWQSVFRWTAAVIAVVVLSIVWYFSLGRNLTGSSPTSGAAQRRINLIADLGDDKVEQCEHPEIEEGSQAPETPLREQSTACVVVGVRDNGGRLRWFFIARATGNGAVRVPRPVRVGHTSATLSNGGVVALAPQVAVRCTPDPNARFEAYIADGRATAAYLNASGELVAIDCSDAL